MNDTHNPELRSWIASANNPDNDFPIQNLPFGVFAPPEAGASQRVGVAIGESVFDVSVANEKELFDADAQRAANACAQPSLNALMALGPGPLSALRSQLSALLAEGAAHRDACAPAVLDSDDVEMRMPVDIGDYTDFYASVFHATNVGSMFRPDNPLLPNYKHIPIAYHGRASSIVVSDSEVRRPLGQSRPDDNEPPVYEPSRLLDYELEMGFFVGQGNAAGRTIPIGEAPDRIFGMCIVNDWSARDVQKWEYQPLGPFLAKSFTTTISPWVVTLEALEPFRVRAFERAAEDPRPLPYLYDEDDQERGGFDITAEVYIASGQMLERGIEPRRVSRGNFSDMYWTIAQMLTHHASNGCNLRPGDLLASGTVSGEDKGSRGCLLELTWRGKDPVLLPTGEERKFLQDGDEVSIRAFCEREGARRIGFGDCRGIISPAQAL